jgi:hypothetical protein
MKEVFKMLTLRRFKALADSYGAELRRWPDDLRGEAEAFLKVSPQARTLLAEARKLDAAIGMANAAEDAGFWPPGEQGAALARLRSGVAGRIASSSVRKSATRPLGWVLAGRAHDLITTHGAVVGMATGSGVAMAAGLLIGVMYVSAPVPAPDNVLAMLQAAPIHILAD